MKRAIVVHCWGGDSGYCWYPWAKSELEKVGFQVEVPDMPNTDEPQFEAWLNKLKEIISSSDEELYLIGHSLGCITIMRYLESLSPSQRIGGVIFVAGFSEDIGFPEIKNFLETPVDYQKVKESVKNGIYSISSDNDPYVDLRFSEIFREKLGAEVVVKHAAGHFSGPVEEDEEMCSELPEVIEGIKKLDQLA